MLASTSHEVVAIRSEAAKFRGKRGGIQRRKSEIDELRLRLVTFGTHVLLIYEAGNLLRQAIFSGDADFESLSLHTMREFEVVNLF